MTNTKKLIDRFNPRESLALTDSVNCTAVFTDLQKETDGYYVRYSDYEQLQAENAELRRERDGLSKKLSRYSMCAGRADQHKAESRMARKLLGFNPDSDHVSPRGLEKALDSHDAEVARKAVLEFTQITINDMAESLPESNAAKWNYYKAAVQDFAKAANQYAQSTYGVKDE